MFEKNILPLIFFCLVSLVAIYFIREKYSIYKEKYNQRIKDEALAQEFHDITTKYINLIKEGMDKDKAIDEIFTIDEIKKRYTKWEMDLYIVTEISDKKIARLNESYFPK